MIDLYPPRLRAQNGTIESVKASQGVRLYTGGTMKLTTLIRTVIAFAPLCGAMNVHAQANGVTLDLNDQNPLSKWGRWTYFEQGGQNYGLRLGQDRGRAPLTAHWREGNWVFKLNKDMLSDRHDLFFGLRLSEDQLQTTSLGCMSNSKKSGFGTALCGVQLDVNLK